MNTIRRDNLKRWFVDKSVPTSERSYFSQLMNGKSSFGEKAARRIESVCGMPHGYLDSSPDNVANAPAVRRNVPLLSGVRAGSWGDIDDHQEDGSEMVAAREVDPGEHAFALRVEGDSMTWDGLPSFPEGTILIVSVQRSPKAGDYVIAKNTKGQSALFKKLMTDGQSWQLNSLNKTYPPIPIEDPSVRVIGVVVEYWNGGKL